MHDFEAMQRGNGLMTVLFVAFAAGAVTIAVIRSISNAGSMATFVSGKLERETIAQMIQMNTSCSKTFPAVPACTHNSYVTLISKTGTNQVLVQSNGTTVIGGYNIRARCVNQPGLSAFGLDIRIAKLSSAPVSGDPRLNFNHSSGNSFQREAVSNLPLGWAHPKAPLFASPGLAPCAAEIGGGSPSGEVPLGGIIMWSGAIVPNGWALCNGQTVNGRTTPDLRGRFIVGSGGTYALGATGGADSVVLSMAQMPNHNHYVFRAGDGVVVGAREDPPAYHNDTGGRGSYMMYGQPGEADFFRSSRVGNDQAHENRPPYYSLAFIMRVQ